MRFHHSTAFTLHEHRFLFDDPETKPETVAEKTEDEKETVDSKSDAEKAVSARIQKAQDKIKEIEGKLKTVTDKITSIESGAAGAPAKESEEHKKILAERTSLQTELDTAKKTEETEKRIADLEYQIQENTKKITENKALTTEERSAMQEQQSALRDELDNLKTPRTIGEGITRDLSRYSAELREAGNDWMQWLVIIGKMFATIMDAYRNFKDLGKPYKKPDEKKDTNNAPKTAQERVDEKLKKNKEEGVPKPKDDAENKEQVKKQNEKDRETLKTEKKTLKENIKNTTNLDKEMFAEKQSMEKELKDLGDDKDKEAVKKVWTEKLTDITKRMEGNQTTLKKYKDDLTALEKKETDLEDEYKVLGGEIKKDEEKPEDKKEDKKEEEKKPVDKRQELKEKIGLNSTDEWIESPLEKEGGVKYLQTETGRVFRSFANMVDEIKKDGTAVEAAKANGFPEGNDAIIFRKTLLTAGLKDWVKFQSGYEYTMYDDGTNIVMRSRKLTKDPTGKIIAQKFGRYVPGKGWSADAV